MTKSKIFIYIAIAFAAGIFFASYRNIETLYVYFLLAFGLAIFGLSVKNNNKFVQVLAVALVFFCLGIIRLGGAEKPNSFSGMFDSKHELEGYIVEEADVRQNNQLLTFRPNGFEESILITTTKAVEYSYGDWVVVEGKITEAKAFDDFDYPKYLERHNVYALTKYPKILVLKTNQLNFFKSKLLKIKAAFTKRINSVLLEPQSSLLLGILIGARKSLPQNIVDDFNTTGTSHIIAVSGFNMTIIISSLSVLAYLVGRKLNFWISLILLCGFVVIAGASASVIRAAVMGFLLLLAPRLERQYVTLSAIFFAGFIMLLINPKILYWDVGFQLSFAATLGIVLFMPHLEKLTEKWTRMRFIKIPLLTTMSAIVATLPIILLDFSRLSVVAPVVNVLILPWIWVVMLVGFLSFLPLAGPGFGVIANILLLAILKITSFFAHLPYSSLEVQITNWTFLALVAAVAACYGLLRFFTRGIKVPVEKSRVV